MSATNWPKWWCIASPNETAEYGYGTQKEALAYAAMMDREDGRQVNCREVSEVDDEESRELDASDEGFELSDWLGESDIERVEEVKP